MTSDISSKFRAGGWQFDADVVREFDGHVEASVPQYHLIQSLVAETTDWLLPQGGVYVDIGASTGTTALRIAARHPGRHIRTYLYDESLDMLREAQVKLTAADNMTVEIRPQSVLKAMDHLGSDLVTALFTLQFIAPEHRHDVLTALHRQSKGTGALIVAEKVRPVDSLWAEIANDCSHDYKHTHGLDDTAIRQKAKALRGVLRPSTVATLLDDIMRAGWQRPETLFRWHQWVVIGAFAR